jgi:hypothetical protein
VDLSSLDDEIISHILVIVKARYTSEIHIFQFLRKIVHVEYIESLTTEESSAECAVMCQKDSKCKQM